MLTNTIGLYSSVSDSEATHIVRRDGNSSVSLVSDPDTLQVSFQLLIYMQHTYGFYP